MLEENKSLLIWLNRIVQKISIIGG
jgi:hypothetical protein